MDQQEQMMRIVMACMKVMYDPKTFQTFKQGLMREGPRDQMLAEEAAGLVTLVDEKFKGALPRELLAGVVMMVVMEMAKFLKDAGEDIEEATAQSAAKQAMELLRQVIQAKSRQPQGQSGQPGQPGQQQAQPQQPAQPQQQPTGLIGMGA